MEPDRDITDRVREISEHTGPPGPEPVLVASDQAIQHLPSNRILCRHGCFLRGGIFLGGDRGRPIHRPMLAQKADAMPIAE